MDLAKVTVKFSKDSFEVKISRFTRLKKLYAMINCFGLPYFNKMIFKITLILLLVTSCAYNGAFRDRECNHNHICCNVGCPCFGRKVGKLNAEPIEKVNHVLLVKDSSYNFIVGKIGGDCGNSRLLHFKSVMETENISSTVYEINLPDSLKSEGLILYIEYRSPHDTELKKCTTEGPGYDQIFIISAKRITQ